jgi:hypothetical protein
MSAMPHIIPDDDLLLKVDRAHKALEGATKAYDAERARVLLELDQKHNPFIWAAQSVLYEAMGNAALAGFTEDDLCKVMHGDFG